MSDAASHIVRSVEELDALYGQPLERALTKETDRLNEDYRAFVEAAPFIVLASVGPQGLDCSPKGDPAGFVRILDARTVAIPDRPGNNRLDNLRNIVADPRVSVLFLIPGNGESLRINGRAHVSADPALLAGFEIAGKLPRTAIVVSIDAVYFHCSKAIVRSKLWDPATRVPAGSLPSPGTILKHLSDGRIDGAAYDRDAPARIQATLY
ncbi:pyridoxamine 5'-phosphate oxidase family protein [Robbsia sp. Bb-Pol-6]|uniref:Pyridoxamine 5'-phosphate oxidase family protein n=1 Tax=Robbsia betulipollinis TaxID=2981849 RepID=A0ABT3ZNS3_9BURK|nr:pyridoxamine 5'-phosphate oxidase family protein [Robbsia betulipollinis]MCY0388180.1 pyridoxamine 5'-phosphate oxidase family protein [Robbsia betulipollinis]